ncbi:MAG: hypothetical protein ACK4VY_00730 [Brevundimonas sp.]
MTELYRIRPADVWLQARDDYLSGLSAETVCRRHDLGLSAFRRRARKYGWRRSDQVDPPPGERNLALYEDLTVEEQIRTARLRFLEALEVGRATEARRWRRLWVELCDDRNALNAEFMAGMTAEQIAADLAGDAATDETEDEARLLAAPRLSSPVGLRLCTKVNSKNLPSPDPT